MDEFYVIAKRDTAYQLIIAQKFKHAMGKSTDKRTVNCNILAPCTYCFIATAYFFPLGLDYLPLHS